MAQEIDALLQESREFPPSEEFRRNANVNDPEIWAKAAKDREKFWAGWAEQLDWHTKWDKVLEWEPPYAKWFTGGKRLGASDTTPKPSGHGRFAVPVSTRERPK